MTAIPQHPEDDVLEREQQHRFDQQVREKCRALVNDELIDEFRHNVFGPHGDALSRLLNYFRRASVKDKLAIYAHGHFSDYQIYRLSGDRYIPPVPVDERRFGSHEEAELAVFLMRVEDLMSSAPHGEVRK